MKIQYRVHKWACVRSGQVNIDSISSSKTLSIKKFVEEIAEPFREEWKTYQKGGWECIKISIEFTAD